MARVIEPVDIDGITFDAMINKTTTYESHVPYYPVEDGFEVSDAIITRPEALDLTLMISNNPITFRALHGQGPGRVQEVLARLREKYFKREPVTVTTTNMTYEEMAITVFSDIESLDYGDSVQLPISFQKIRSTERQMTEMTARFVGAANVTQGAPAPTAAQARAAGGGGDSRGSALHGLATAAGIFR